MSKPRRKSEIRAAAQQKTASLRMFRSFGADAMSACWRARMVEALKSGKSVTAAARAAGVSRASAYRARTRDAGFAAQWHAALPELDPEAFADPCAPQPIPIFRGGLQIGYKLKYDVAAMLGAARGRRR